MGMLCLQTSPAFYHILLCLLNSAHCYAVSFWLHWCRQRGQTWKLQIGKYINNFFRPLSDNESTLGRNIFGMIYLIAWSCMNQLHHALHSDFLETCNLFLWNFRLIALERATMFTNYVLKYTMECTSAPGAQKTHSIWFWQLFDVYVGEALSSTCF